MRRLAFFLLFAAVPAVAEEKAKPNTLTPKEIADGWILLFDGETTFGWKVEGEAKIKDGVLHLGGEKPASITATTSFGLSSVHFSYSRSGATTAEINGKEHPLALPKTKDEVIWTTDVALDEKIQDGAVLEHSYYVDPAGKALMSMRRLEPSTTAHSVRFSVAAGGELSLHSIKLKPASTAPLFNGKDLAGWKVYDPERAKVADPKTKPRDVQSKFTVTNEGWLNVKEGPGDLQTEGQWADFVVQLECISNGKFLNSGLFFRAIPDLYQQGYEAQIHNGFLGDDRTRPMDYGTGAIYRRVPARKVVPNDREWFTMTVAARGRHIATWVNGYQVVDWTDDRKEDANGRNGFKAGKGVLSIQGHDKTTDLSFRNIRIQSLDK